MSKITVIGSLFFYGNKYKAAVFFSRIELRGDNKVALFKDMAVSWRYRRVPFLATQIDNF